MFGKHHSEKSKKLISDKRKGSKLNDDHKNKIRQTLLKLHFQSDEVRNKISKAGKGRKLSEKHKKILSERMKGDNNPSRKYGISEEKRRKQSERMKGKNHHFYGKKGPMSGKNHSDKSKNKMSISKLGSNNPMFGKKLSKERINNLIGTSKRYKIILPNKNIIIIKNLRKYCDENKISYWGMMRVVSGKQEFCQQFQCIRLEEN